MTDEATQRPWRTGDDGHDVYPTVGEVKLAISLTYEGYGYDSRANAALIVKAVNQHDALLELVRDMLPYIAHNDPNEHDNVKQCAAFYPPYGHCSCSFYGPLKARARAILEPQEEE